MKRIFSTLFLLLDAPEKAQAFGTKANVALATLVFQKDVTITVVDTIRR